MELLHDCGVQRHLANESYTACRSKFAPDAIAEIPRAMGVGTILDRFTRMSVLQLHAQLEGNGYQEGVPGIGAANWAQLKSTSVPSVPSIFRLVALYWDCPDQETFVDILRGKGIQSRYGGQCYSALSQKIAK